MHPVNMMTQTKYPDLQVTPSDPDYSSAYRQKSGNSPTFQGTRVIETVYLLLLCIVFRVLFTHVFSLYIVHGNSMYPALRDGDLCITYRLEPYTNSEVIAFRTGGAVRFARIAAGQNDTVEITQDEILLINGYQPAEEIFFPTLNPSEESYQFTVPDGEWYLLNDCRTDLSDSRTYGSMPEESFCGKLIFLIRRRGF